MAFGDKAAQIDALTTQVEELQERLARVEPFAGPAEEMQATYDDLSRTASQDPTRLPADLYQEAVDRVTAQRRRQVVAAAAGRIAAQRGEEIEQEIITKEGEAIETAERKRFAAEEEPELRRSTETRVRRRITEATRTQLRTERPAAIEAEYIEAHSAEIIAAETERFEREEGRQARSDAEARAKRGITEATRKEIRDRIGAEAALAALRAAEDDERFKLRIKIIAENARRTHQIPMAHLAAGDVVTIDFCEVGQTFGDSNSTPSKWTRQLRLSVIAPEQGIAMVLDDSWEVSSPLARRQAFHSGALLLIGTAVEVPNKSADAATAAKPMLLITRSVPLQAVHNEVDKTDPDFEVDKVYIDTNDGKKLLLGEEKTTRRGY